MRRLFFIIISFMIVLTLFAGCKKEEAIKGTALDLTDDQIENIVLRSYQYVALYNVINKGAMDLNNPTRSGWNSCFTNTQLTDHNLKIIARPNNDTLYISCGLDLRKDALILDMPAFSSKYVSLMTFGYDHYVNVPLTTRKGDFKRQEKILFYTKRTDGYGGEKIEGINHIVEMATDFSGAVLRIMPHANEQEKFNSILNQMKSVQLETLSEYRGGKTKPIDDITLPPFGQTDLDVYENNFLEVMQFVVNHTTFDQKDEIDKAFLAAMKPLGIEPGKTYDKNKAANIDGKRFRAVTDKFRERKFARAMDPEQVAKFGTTLFQPKGQMSLDMLALQSVLGPIGLPATEAVYPTVATKDGKPMNAQHDYVIRMSKDQMPPARAFWSLTLYDTANGFFIPNDQKKYSVGENAGMKLNADGGIEIYVASKQPEGVPRENWLPINRKDENLDIILRMYVPDLDKLKTWEAPKAEKISK